MENRYVNEIGIYFQTTFETKPVGDLLYDSAKLEITANLLIRSFVQREKYHADMHETNFSLKTATNSLARNLLQTDNLFQRIKYI